MFCFSAVVMSIRVCTVIWKVRTFPVARMIDCKECDTEKVRNTDRYMYPQ